MVLVSASAVAQQAAPEPTLKPGSEVNLAPLIAAQWIQGEAPKSFESGKVYIFECWATWCGPCVRAIPHMNELYKKYHAKGLEVYGMNVWEDGKEKVEKFVKSKGDGMSYPVAYTGKGSAFEKEWLKPSGARGIPHALIVRNGKLLMTSHPARLTDSVIEALLSGDAGKEKVAAEMKSPQNNSPKGANLAREIRMAGAEGNAETMAAKIAELEKLEANSPYLPGLKLDLLMVKKDWPAVTKAISDLPPGPAKQMSVMMTASKIAGSADGAYPPDFVKFMASSLSETIENSKMPANPMILTNLSRLQWKGGDKQAASASANKAAEAAKPATNQTKGRALPPEPFNRFAKSVTEGTMPTAQELSNWLSEEMKKSATAKANKANPETIDSPKPPAK